MIKRILFFSLLSCSLAMAQAFRVDPTPVMTTAGNVPLGGFPALYAVAGASIEICTDAACTIPATTYTNAAGNVVCPIDAQVTLPGSSLCTPYAGTQGQFGFWLTSGNYYYTVTPPGRQTAGPYPISVSASATNWITLSNAPVFDIRTYGAACTGGDDTTGIQAAVTAAQAAGGGTVLIPALTCHVTRAVTITSGHIAIVGVGSESVILASTNAALGEVFFNSNNTSSTVTMSDFVIDGNRANGGMSTSVSYLVYFASSNWTIRNMEFRNAPLVAVAYGDAVTSPTNTKFLNNYFHDIGGYVSTHGGVGITVAGNEGTGLPTGSVVSGNTFQNIYSLVGPTVGDSTSVNGLGDNVVFTNNIIVNVLNVNGGMMLAGTCTGLGSTTVTGNLLIRSASLNGDLTAGIEVCNSNATISDNVIIGANNDCIRLEGNAFSQGGYGPNNISNISVSGNQCVASGGYGLNIIQAATSYGVFDVIASGNQFSGGAGGVACQSPSTNITLAANDFTGTAGTLVSTGCSAFNFAPSNTKSGLSLAARTCTTMSGTQSIGSSSWTSLSWDTNNCNGITDNGVHSTSVNPTRFAPTGGQSGYYRFTCQADWSGNATGSRTLRILENASSVLGQTSQTVVSAGDFTSQQVSADVFLDPSLGAYLECQAWQSSGGSLNVNGPAGNTFATFLRVQ